MFFWLQAGLNVLDLVEGVDLGFSLEVTGKTNLLEVFSYYLFIYD